MSDMDLQRKAVNSLVLIHAAIKNDQLYSSLSGMITDFIETLYLYIVENIRQESPSVFAQLETTTSPAQNISNQKDEKTIPVSALLEILHVLNLKNFSFEKNLEKEELSILVNFIAQKPTPAQVEAESPKIIMEEKAEPILPDDKVVMEIEMPPEITAGQETSEEKFYKNMAEAEIVFTRLNAMDGAIESIPSAEKIEMINHLSVQAAQWLETETKFTPEFKETCLRLQKLLQGFIQNGFMAEANPIINVFSRINEGKLIKHDK